MKYFFFQERHIFLEKATSRGAHRISWFQWSEFSRHQKKSPIERIDFLVFFVDAISCENSGQTGIQCSKCNVRLHFCEVHYAQHDPHRTIESENKNWG